jgi:O-antigen ligase
MKPTIPSKVAEAAPLVIASLFFLALMFLGGASRADAASQPFVRLAAVLLGAGALLLPGPGLSRTLPGPTAFVGLFALLIALQLLPLPPEVWGSLPGRQIFARLDQLAGLGNIWRPLSIDPDRTLNALLALTVPATTILIFSRFPHERWFLLLCIMLSVVAVSALFALGQASGRLDALYLYRVTSEGAPVGLLANRNHQAFLLAMAFPIMGAFAAYPLRKPPRFDPRPAIAILGGLFLAPLVLVTGSRAGLLLMGVGIVAALILYFAGRTRVEQNVDPRLKHRPWLATRRIQIGVIGGIGVIGLAMVLTVLLSRAEALQRVLNLEIGQDQRARLFDLLVSMTGQYMPWGVGFGTFDPVFRMHEPFSNLGPRYLNHAHNDWIELGVEGGVPAYLLLAAFIVWFCWRTARHWIRGQRRQSRAELLGRLGSILIIMLGTASLSDYPLRTPLMAAMFALSCCLISREPGVEAQQRRGSRSSAVS